jgi:hypothetical protein
MRTDYEARLKALEQRLLAAERPAPVSPAGTEPQPAQGTGGAAPVQTAPSGVSPVAAAAGGANAFNPAMPLILSTKTTGWV